MTARILRGKDVAAPILAALREPVAVLAARRIVPMLVFVTIGDSPQAQMYVHRLERLARDVGVRVDQRQLPGNSTLEELDAIVAQLNASPGIDGVIVQMPLPHHLTSMDLSTIIDPRKDVDGITVWNAGCLYLGMPAPVASTGVAMMEILRYAGIDPAGRHAVVVGRSQVVGRPVAELLLHANATVTVTHRQTEDLGAMTRQADLLFVGAGSPGLITANMISRGVTIVDAGINVSGCGLVGDVDFEGCLPLAGGITPVPGGVGPVTNAVLLRHVVHSAERRPAG